MQMYCRAVAAAILLTCMAAPVFAQEAPDGTPQIPFAEFKVMHLTRLTRYIAILQAEESCAQAANRSECVARLRRSSPESGGGIATVKAGWREVNWMFDLRCASAGSNSP